MKISSISSHRLGVLAPVILGSVFFAAGTASAQLSPVSTVESDGARECHAVSPTGQVIVATANGETIRGTLMCVTRSQAWLVQDGRMSQIPLRQARRIRTPADPAWDGAAKGAMIPLIIGAVLCHSCSAEPMLRTSVAYGLVGLATDALDTNRQTIYRTRGRSLSVGWGFKF